MGNFRNVEERDRGDKKDSRPGGLVAFGLTEHRWVPGPEIQKDPRLFAKLSSRPVGLVAFGLTEHHRVPGWERKRF